ncbi:hypothetical protein M231_01038, partial [Tremella mesenterica]
RRSSKRKLEPKATEDCAWYLWQICRAPFDKIKSEKRATRNRLLKDIYVKISGNRTTSGKTGADEGIRLMMHLLSWMTMDKELSFGLERSRVIFDWAPKSASIPPKQPRRYRQNKSRVHQVGAEDGRGGSGASASASQVTEVPDLNDTTLITEW